VETIGKRFGNSQKAMKTRTEVHVGDLVEVRSKEEILQILDSNGQIDGMPFMPEMFAFCGQRFKVYKSAHKTCDYTSYPFFTRRLARTVHLETRCNGAAHDGCQAGCLLYWKYDWLKVVREDSQGESSGRVQPNTPASNALNPASGCSEDVIWRNVRLPQTAGQPLRYSCQMTQIPHATTPLAWWDVRQYAQDLLSGNVSLRRIVNGLAYWVYYSLSQAGIGVGRPMRWLYNKISPLVGGSFFPRNAGLIPQGQQTPFVKLHLQPGELVRVKSHQEILKTVDTDGKNRGMYWDAELVPYCGKTYKVLRNVSKLIAEQTGEMKEMKNPCIVLEHVVCQARYSSCRYFCPKAMYPFWREIWLERVDQPVPKS
jgi:hypothetical protein